MSLIPYEPFRHLENMQRELSRFLQMIFYLPDSGKISVFPI